MAASWQFPADRTGTDDRPAEHEETLRILPAEPHLQDAPHLGNGVYECGFELERDFSALAGETWMGEPPHHITLSAFAIVVLPQGLDGTVRLALGVPYDRPGPAYRLSASDLDAVVDADVFVDFAMAIVGDTTHNAARLWFAWNGRIPGGWFACEIGKLPPRHTVKPDPTQPVADGFIEPLPPLPVPWALPVSFDSERSNTAIVQIEDLLPATRYRYKLRYAAAGGIGPGLGRIVATGEFTTTAVSPRRLSLVFGSCHQPVIEEDLHRWEALALRQDYDLLLLIGDQIYEDYIWANWDQRYRSQYRQYWAYRPMRQVLRRTPTYMIFDDHEVKDDWGTNFPRTQKDRDRERAALRAYEIFQHSHNPMGLEGGSSAERPPGERVYHYHFRRGPFAFFMMDVRSNRRIPDRLPPPRPPGPDWRGWSPRIPRKDPPDEFEVLGQKQLEAFETWANSEARQADVVFVVTPVPIAYLPAEEVRRLLDVLKDAGADLGAATGAAALGGFEDSWWMVPPPFNLPGLIGFVGGSIVGRRRIESALRERGLLDLYTRDFADMWTQDRNQPNLCRVLGTLFDLANDVTNGEAGPRPRAIFLLGGDVHVGAMHRIVSERGEARNPRIYQLVSSPISNEPPSGLVAKTLETVVRHIKPGRNITKEDLNNFKKEFGDEGFFEPLAKHIFGETPADFPLDDQKKLDNQPSRLFRAEFQSMLVERNFGRVSVVKKVKKIDEEMKIDAEPRAYKFSLAVEGKSDGVGQLLEMDPGRGGDLVTETLIAEGRVAEGDLIKGPASPAVFLVEFGERRLIPDEATSYRGRTGTGSRPCRRRPSTRSRRDRSCRGPARDSRKASPRAM
jgi:PhoD-like phosphatase